MELLPHTLYTYFSDMKIDPKSVFLHAVVVVVFFFLIFCHPFSQIYGHRQKHTPFPFGRFCTPNDILAYTAWS